MPKMKTRKAVAKRFKVTKNGKVLHRQAGKSHLLTKKDSQRKRQKRNDKKLETCDMKRVKRMLPYG